MTFLTAFTRLIMTIEFCYWMRWITGTIVSQKSV